MKWFFSINDCSESFENYAKLVKVAVHTALKNTDLHPICLYDGTENELTVWMRRKGVKIIHHRTPHYEALKSLGQRAMEIGSGAFLRVEIPIVMKTYQMEDEYVLYTDVDVVFVKNITDELSHVNCDYFAASAEHIDSKGNLMNSGVMYINRTGMLETYEEFNKYIANHLPILVKKTFDQSAYEDFYSGKWNSLDITFNWRSYWESNPMAKIIHFHARSKPHHIINITKSEYNTVQKGWRMVNYNSVANILNIWCNSYDEIVTEELRIKRAKLEEVRELKGVFDNVLSCILHVNKIEKLFFEGSKQNQKFIKAGRLDFPQREDKLIIQNFVISGWVVGEESPVQEIVVYQKDNCIANTKVERLRPDIAKLYPSIEYAEKSGFQLRVLLSSMDINTAKIELTIKGTFNDGSIIPLFKIGIEIDHSN